MNDRQMLATIERFNTLVVAGDAEALIAEVDPAIEWHNPDDATEPGVRTGRAGFGHAVRALRDAWDYEAFDVARSQRFGDEMLVEVAITGAGRSSGAPGNQTLTHRFSFNEGRVSRFEWFRKWDQGVAAIETQ